ncbi:YhcN/YlaJ family sporulation lipoprotein [Paenibacillus lentus]|uniref:YhcN/YlaJ family sporulation lipoprotein n=1 Tax=Paenibacillus lentus TaxID=1338368 RepID=A0A3Q8S4Z4_9BACL|nr:YhcN/YlaJ family sporulation lipoprotein [Paenibacillus lentus]AZK46865.1 YhcN/YlaJ family sporulation lipoprotein [Paenibacillus lentus]
MRIGLYLLLTAILLTGCGTASQKASPSPQSQQNNSPRAQSIENDGMPITDNANNMNNNVTNANNQGQLTKQAHLEQLVMRVPGVKGAHCVIMGNTAIVGIDVDGNLERASVGNIKYTVAEALRKDPQGAGAIVTADIDLNNRIAEIGDKMRAGHPVSGFATELADIIGRIIPQMPRDTVPRTENDMQGRKPGAGSQPSTESHTYKSKSRQNKNQQNNNNNNMQRTPQDINNR